MSVSFSGELAYEIHIPNASLYAVYLALREAGAAYGMKLFGSRAVESMRMEKGFLHWKADLLTEFDPFETGLSRFVKMDKPNFVGKSALEERLKAGSHRKLVSLKIDCTHAPAYAGASLMEGKEVIGSISSGDWGHRVGLNLAYAFVNPDKSEIGTVMELDHLGDMVRAEVIAAGPYDPSYERIRA
jgi:dimethylglycine dehydrogenase